MLVGAACLVSSIIPDIDRIIMLMNVAAREQDLLPDVAFDFMLVRFAMG